MRDLGVGVFLDADFAEKYSHGLTQFFRVLSWAGYRLPAGKYGGILTDFQTKVNKKISSVLDTGYSILDARYDSQDTLHEKCLFAHEVF